MHEVLGKTAGVAKVETSLKTMQAVVKYDPALTTPEKLAEVLTKHRGVHRFEASVVQ